MFVYHCCRQDIEVNCGRSQHTPSTFYKLARSRTAKSPEPQEDSSHRSRLPPAVNESRQQARKRASKPSSGQPADHSAAAVARTAPTAAPAAATPLPLGRPAFSARAAGSLKFGVETGLRASVPRQQRIETIICQFPRAVIFASRSWKTGSTLRD
ncbi:hypothetical protein BC567DRAFT_70661 [Phyllosticta citribraziliensis]